LIIASFIAVVSQCNVVVKDGTDLIKRIGLAGLVEVNNLQVARGGPPDIRSDSRNLISVVVGNR